VWKAECLLTWKFKGIDVEEMDGIADDAHE